MPIAASRKCRNPNVIPISAAAASSSPSTIMRIPDEGRTSASAISTRATLTIASACRSGIDGYLRHPFWPDRLKLSLRPRSPASEGTQKRDQVLFFLRSELGAKDQIEELDGVFQRQKTRVMQVGRVVLGAAQREGFDRTVADCHHVVDHRRLEETLGVEVVHQIVGVEGRLVAAGALALAEEDILAAHFGWGRFSGIELAKDVEFWRWRKIQHLLEIGHEIDLAAALERVHPLFCRLHDVAVEIGRALLEFGEVFDRLQGPLRPEKPLHVQAAKRDRLDAVAEPLGACVRSLVRRAVLVPIGMTIEASRALAGQLRAAVLGRIELLLRKGGQQQPQSFQLPWRQNPV